MRYDKTIIFWKSIPEHSTSTKQVRLVERFTHMDFVAGWWMNVKSTIGNHYDPDSGSILLTDFGQATTTFLKRPHLHYLSSQICIRFESP